MPLGGTMRALVGTCSADREMLTTVHLHARSKGIWHLWIASKKGLMISRIIKPPPCARTYLTEVVLLKAQHCPKLIVDYFDIERLSTLFSLSLF